MLVVRIQAEEWKILAKDEEIPEHGIKVINAGRTPTTGTHW